MAFEPISGTIGAVAFVDQMFSRCVWTYKKYKLSEDFGKDYVGYTIKYHSEVARFNEVISHPHSGLKENALDLEQRHLKDTLRDRLLLWMSDLEKCENLVAKCERKLEPGDGVIEDDAAEQASAAATHGTQISEPPTLSAAPSLALNTLASSAVSLRASASQTTPSLATESSATSVPDSAAPPSHEKKGKSKRKRFLVYIGIKDHERHSELARRPRSPTEHNMPIAEQGSPGGSSFLPAPAAASAELADRATEVHGRSKLLGRLGWVAESRSDFIALLKELRQHANFFNSMIQLDQSKRMMLRSQRADELKTKVDKFRDIGGRLRILLQSLDGLTGSNQVAFQLMLHNDPLSLQSNFRTSSKLLSFRPGSAAFYARVLPSTPENMIRDSAAPARVPEAQLNSPRYLVFDVQQTSASSPPPTITIATTELSSVSHLLDDTVEAAQRPNWARELGHIKATGTLVGFISVFSDSTIHAAEMTLADSLNDEREKQLFQLPSQASSRAQLALVLTCSLIYAQTADGARDLTAKQLAYYDTKPADGQAADLRHSRINPFVLLQMVGLPTTTETSHMALTSAARDNDDKKMTMIKSLGILLYEIGSWTVSVGDTVAERANFVKSKTGVLAGDMSVRYHDIIGSCLRAEKEKLVNLETWMIENVAGPLQHVLSDIEELRLIT